MSLNQSFIYLFLISQNIHADLKGPKVKYKQIACEFNKYVLSIYSKRHANFSFWYMFHRFSVFNQFLAWSITFSVVEAE